MSIIPSVGLAVTQLQARARGQKFRNKELLGIVKSDIISQDRKFEKIKKLLAKGADVNARDKLGSTALLEAACRGHLEIVKLLLDKGADINAKDFNEQTALHNASLKGNLKIVKALVRAGANLDARDEYGITVTKAIRDGAHYVNVKNVIEEGKNELIKLYQDESHKYPKKQEYINLFLQKSLTGTSEVTREIVQFIEKPLSESQKKQAQNYIEERKKEVATKIQQWLKEIKLAKSNSQKVFEWFKSLGNINFFKKNTLGSKKFFKINT